MRVSLFCAPLLIAAFAACTTNTVVQDPAPAQPAAPAEEAPALEDEAPPAETPDVYGNPISAKTPVVELAKILADPATYKNKRIVTEGNVRQVCQEEGCWAEIRPIDSTDDTLTMRCTFEGYQFVIPKDSKGTNIKVDGTVSVDVLSAAEVAHLEGEGASVPNKNADGTATAATLIARGLEMTGYKKK